MLANYFEEDNEEIKGLWAQGSASLARINPAVITDIDDHFLLQAFRCLNLDERTKQKQVSDFLEKMRNREKMHVLKTVKETKTGSPVKGKPHEDIEAMDDPIEKGKEVDRKNGFLSKWLPN
jgi:hypothetical protein